MPSLTVLAPSGMKMIAPGELLAPVILKAFADAGEKLIDNDIVVIAQKIISKAEGRTVRLDSVIPGDEAISLAEKCGRDPRVVELILAESRSVLRAETGAIVVEHRLGFVLANAGIDQSNVDQTEPSVLLLPVDPDSSAQKIRESLKAETGADVAVLIIDSIGRAWRNGTIGTTIGAAGLPALLDLRRVPDLFGRPLQSSELGLADEIAAAASLMMGQAGEGRPVALVRGVPYSRRAGCASELIRPRDKDMFR
jgi:coenzyme F420-0:L-glutamate ligase / coenzyme F420-1:gamma-L-glutamate ligase